MLFSIIIPTYNRENSIARAIESCIDQTFKDFEIIVVDDGSTDNSKDIIQRYIKKIDKLTYIHQKNSGLPAAARNTGIQKAKGEWIVFLDSDDFIFPNKLEETKKIINKNLKDVIVIGHWETNYTNDKPVKVNKFRQLDPTNQHEDLLFNGNALSPSSVAIKASALKELGGFSIKKEYFGIEDYDMWLRASLIGNLFMIDKSLAGYDLGDDSISNNIENMNRNLLNVITDHINKLEINDLEKAKLLKVHGSRVKYYKGRAYHLNRDFKNSKYNLIESIKDYPWEVKRWVTLIFTYLKLPY